MGSGVQTQVLTIAWQTLTELASQTLVCFEAGSNYVAQAGLDLVVYIAQAGLCPASVLFSLFAPPLRHP